MGDPAEAACDRVYGHDTHKLGLDREWQSGKRLYMAKMTAAMRYTPDRLVKDAFVECMGIGRDQTLKIKLEKVYALNRWNHIGPTDLFVYDQPKETFYQANILDWEEAFADAPVKTFPEGKQYYSVHRDSFPGLLNIVPPESQPCSKCGH